MRESSKDFFKAKYGDADTLESLYNLDDDEDYVDDYGISVKDTVVENPRFPRKLYGRAIMSRDPYHRVLIAQKPDISQQHVNSMIREDPNIINHLALYHMDKVTPEHIVTALNTPLDAVGNLMRGNFVANHANRLTPEHIHAIIHHSPAYAHNAIRSVNASEQNLLDALDLPSSYARKIAAGHSVAATEKTIEKARHDHDPEVRLEAIRNPAATQDQIRQHLNDPSDDVRRVAKLMMFE